MEQNDSKDRTSRVRGCGSARIRECESAGVWKAFVIRRECVVSSHVDRADTHSVLF